MRYIIPFLLVSTIAVISCKKNNLPAQSFQYTGGYNATIAESWDGKLRLMLKSNTDLNCMNYGIGHTLTLGASSIALDISGVSAPATCRTGDGPATDTPSLGLLGVKAYALSINCDGTEVTGTLTVTNNKYTVSYPGGNNVTFTKNDLNRVPDHTLWGTIDYDASYSKIVDTFLQDSLSFYGAVNFTGPLVTYTDFIAGSGNTFSHWRDGSMPRPYKNFIYTFSGTNSDLTRLMNSYKRYGDNVKIAMTTDHLFFGTGTSW